MPWGKPKWTRARSKNAAARGRAKGRKAAKRDALRRYAESPPKVAQSRAGFKYHPRMRDPETRAAFDKNDAEDPNRDKPGYVQAEDGSWVPTSFYRKRK